MKIARFWVKERGVTVNKKGQAVEVAHWSWSENSREEARQRAAEAVRQAVARVAAGEPWPRTKEYYPDRPPREEIVEEVKNKQGEVIAIITRNAYGALVLNTTRLMFIDVDFPFKSPVLVSGPLSLFFELLARLFGKETEDPADALQQKLIDLARANLHYAFRIYRTRAGFRCIVINKPIDPASLESQSLLDAFGADPLYVRLCKNQECFRARLTPKPWRCGARKPPNRFPWDNAEDERTYRAWQQQYEAKSRPFATCRIIEQIGTAHPDAALVPLLDFHDKLTKAASGLDLA